MEESENDDQVDTPKRKLFTIKKFAQKHAEMGTWPATDTILWAFRAESPDNGFDEVFVNVGRRVLIDEEKFWKAVDKLNKDTRIKRWANGVR